MEGFSTNNVVVVLDTEKLILLVQERTPLWDTSNPCYQNRDISKKLWSEIADELGCTMSQAKAKWQNLRDTFRKEHTKNIKKVTGSAAANTKVPWKYINQLAFLNDVFVSRPMLSNFPSTSSSEFSETIVAEINFNNSDSLDEAAVRDPEIVLPIEKPKLQCKRKADKADAINQLITLEKKKLEQIEKINDKQEIKNDDNYHFLLSLLPYFEDMPKRVSLLTRMKIQQVIFDTIDDADCE
ncbi:uncharacterized protein LOC131937617 [Physella acuta]|uniref:uncharacterized protein LOC131937617 n=1 Tax=Physella acuta TaxID=109671 RepID=UPI0027DD9F58|nr:uncharacterized protein LOC131937617 [Physella acuta]